MKKTVSKRVFVTLLFIFIFVLSICTAAALLLYFGVVLINDPSKEKYPVRGVDVSAYQGKIDWGVLSGQDIDFAYMKATEGSSFTDECFSQNWQGASDCGLRIGAYHFFSLESPGADQAKHFLDVVKPVENMLPPVVDAEPYGEYTDLSDEAISELAEWLTSVENSCGKKPIIYTTEKWYDSRIKEAFPGYGIWIRSVYSKPKTSGWTFWQYTNRMKLDGYDGEERYIDMNVFCGSAEEFAGI